MAPKEKQTIEIEKTDRDPLLSFNQAVTVDCSDFLGTALWGDESCGALRQEDKKEHRKDSRHDDFVLEAAGGNDQENGADREEGEAVGPEMLDAGAAKDDAARDIDEIRGRDEIADRFEEGWHGFARENITGEENTGQNWQESELHGFRLGVGFAGNEDPQRERGEEIGQREYRE